MIQWEPNIIIADGDYIDKVAFNFIVNFERMIGRHIPKADMAQWVECIALDGGLKTIAADATDRQRKKNDTLVILLHDGKSTELNNFNPSSYNDELSGHAFKGDVGEFAFHSIPTSSTPGFTKEDVIKDLMLTIASEDSTHKVMVIPDLDDDSQTGGLPTDSKLCALTPTLRKIDRDYEDIRLTLFSMQPLTGIPCRQEILGYSLMAALGIRSSEINP